jgi:mycoredoxin
MSAGYDVSVSVANVSLVMYSTPWCGYCRRLKAQLDRAGIDYTEIDISDDPEAAALVERINRGNQTVPTVLLPNGQALTNPTIPQVTAALSTTV